MKYAVVIFSFNRPLILKECLEKLSTQNNIEKFDVYLYQDNCFNPYSKKYYCKKNKIIENIIIFNKLFPKGIVNLKKQNVGVGLNHFTGYEDIFIKHGYNKGIFLDDDIVLENQFCLDTLLVMDDMTQNNPSVMGSELYPTPFKYISDKHKILLLDTFKYHIPYQGFCCSKEKFNKIYNFYKNQVNELFKGIDYKERWRTLDIKLGITFENKIKNFYQKEGMGINTYYSQDWVRDTCFRHFKMNKKAILNINLIKNIGNIGVHSDEECYYLEGFGDVNIYTKKINLDNNIIDINDENLLISNNPPRNTFSFTYKDQNIKNYLVKKHNYRFKI